MREIWALDRNGGVFDGTFSRSHNDSDLGPDGWDRMTAGNYVQFEPIHEESFVLRFKAGSHSHLPRASVGAVQLVTLDAPPPQREPEPTLPSYTISYLGNTHSEDPEGKGLEYVPGWVSDIAVGPHDVVYMAGGGESRGVAAFRYDPEEDRVRIVARYGFGGVGQPGASALAIDDQWLYLAGEPNHCGPARYPLYRPGGQGRMGGLWSVTRQCRWRGIGVGRRQRPTQLETRRGQPRERARRAGLRGIQG